jgi:hypothetical protein
VTDEMDPKCFLYDVCVCLGRLREGKGSHVMCGQVQVKARKKKYVLNKVQSKGSDV